MRIVNGCILLLAAISITFAAVSGAYHLDMQQLLALILRQENVSVQEQIVFWQIRVPRILAALLLGAALADPYTQLPSITFWLLGGLSTVTLRDLCYAAPIILIGSLPLFFLRWRMNLLTLSDDEARSLGLNVTRLRFGLIVCATLITASTVAIAGIIGWIGLVVPHIARLLTGHNHQQLLPMAMCTGAILLLLTDTLARSIGTTEIPLGILTAFVGAPFFLLLLLRGGRQ
ncbi:FecCD family ABC transporter permease [Escherichia coli]